VTSARSLPLHRRLELALRAGGDALDGLAGATPTGRRDEVLTLLEIHDLHLAPIDQLGDRVRWQHHPSVATLKAALEERFLARLEDADVEADESTIDDKDSVAAMRRLAAADLIPEVYEWAADEAEWDDLVAFLAIEGGPDGGFDDLVALCQVGIDGGPKLELARNYWDEMGRGSLAEVHTELHRLLSRTIDLPVVPRTEQPIEALERSVLGSVLATNRRLQPEMLGALGLLELQAGPRCRKVVRGLERLDAPDGALAFYVEHATTDPRHGKDWLDNVVTPLADDPVWAPGIVRGARWRSAVNRAFFVEAARRFVPPPAPERLPAEAAA
jgi:hypothetical protein